jgi:hypothetical protein
MKPNGNLRKDTPEDTLHKTVKLSPIKKSGKEKQSLYRELDKEGDLTLLPRRKSVLDYYDDVDEQGWDTPEEDEEDEDLDEDWLDEDE